MKYSYSEDAIKQINKLFNKKERLFIDDKINYLAQNYEQLKKSKKVTEIKNHNSLLRYKINDKIRAIFTLINDEIEILIIRVDFRKNIYDDLA